jgi:hypothetical protein
VALNAAAQNAPLSKTAMNVATHRIVNGTAETRTENARLPARFASKCAGGGDDASEMRLISCSAT